MVSPQPDRLQQLELLLSPAPLSQVAPPSLTKQPTKSWLNNQHGWTEPPQSCAPETPLATGLSLKLQAIRNPERRLDNFRTESSSQANYPDGECPDRLHQLENAFTITRTQAKQDQENHHHNHHNLGPNQIGSIRCLNSS